jgi:hypothetical protein
MMRKQPSGLPFANELAAGTATSIGLHRAINCMQEFCKEWKQKINIEKTKIVVLKTAERLRIKNGDWEQKKQK